ncbi:MAG: hypothetical protein K6A23_11815 [Butyrivibrio sp.]|nr:hypothetical protein [Butyrivibrio sp.]
MSDNRKKFPYSMTKRALIFYIIFIVLLGVFFFFVRDDLAGKLIAFMVCPMMIAYMIYAYLKEKKADKNAIQKNEKFTDGTYFKSPEWHNEYVIYKIDHPFERTKYQNMKKDLLKRFQRREYIFLMVVFLFLIFCTGCAAVMKFNLLVVFGFCFFAYFFYEYFALFIGMPVRKWLKGDICYKSLEASYINSQMLIYKKNGLSFGTTHIHGFTEKKIYAIDYKLAEGISRKVVRLKKYEDGIYSSEEYRHFAVIQVRLPHSGDIQNVEIELNEFQVQMAIDRFVEIKINEGIISGIHIKEEKENDTVM